MDPLTIICSPQFMLFGLAIASIILVIRAIVEYLLGLLKIDYSKNKLWNDVILPILPVGIGALWAMYLKTYPYPNNLISQGDRIIFGMVAGLLSGLTYRMVKSLMYQKVIDAVNKLNNKVVHNEQIAPEDIPPRGQL
jgi:hypothetical protein